MDEQVDILFTGTVIHRGSVPLPALGDITVERREKEETSAVPLSYMHSTYIQFNQCLKKRIAKTDDHEKEGKRETRYSLNG